MRTSRFLLIALAAVTVAASSAACTASAGAPSATTQALAADPTPTLPPTTAPTLASTFAPTVTPSSTPALLPIPPGDSTPGSTLKAGARYVTADPFPIRVSFVAPAGWAGNIGGPYAVWTGPAATGNTFSFQLSQAVYTDPCHPEHGTVAGPSPTSTAAALVQALISRPGLAKTTPTTTSLAGRPATSFTLTLGRSSICDRTYLLWELPLGATNELQPGMSERIWVVEVDGQVLTVEADSTGGAAAQQAIQQALDSLRFEPGG